MGGGGLSVEGMSVGFILRVFRPGSAGERRKVLVLLAFWAACLSIGQASPNLRSSGVGVMEWG